MPQLQLYCIYFFHMNLYPFCTDCLLFWFWPINVAVFVCPYGSTFTIHQSHLTFYPIHLFSLYPISFKRSLSLPLPHHFYFLSFFYNNPLMVSIWEGICPQFARRCLKNSYRYSQMTHWNQTRSTPLDRLAHIEVSHQQRVFIYAA